MPPVEPSPTIDSPAPNDDTVAICTICAICTTTATETGGDKINACPQCESLLRWFQQKMPGLGVTFNSSLAHDVAIDSFALVELIVGLEEKTSTRIPDDAGERFETIGELIAYVQAAK